MSIPEKFERGANTRQKGLTILELMIVFAIVSILALVAIPQYQNYTIRAKIAGDLSLVKPLTMKMDEEYQVNDRWPASNAEAGALAPEGYKGQYLMSALISDSPQEGTMTLTFDASELPVLRGSDTLVFYPSSASKGSNWQCDQGTIPAKYRPPRCQ